MRDLVPGLEYVAGQERPTRAPADARLGRFEVMLVWALDRVSREGVEATLAILRRFAGHGPLKEPWAETADPRNGRAARVAVRLDGGRRDPPPSERTGAGLERRKRGACRSAGRRARRIRSRDAAVDTWRGGSENGPWQADAGPF